MPRALPAGCGPGLPRPAGACARRFGGSGRPRRGQRVVACRRSRPRQLAERRQGARRRRAGSARPWTSWSSCTANSMSRMPPRPSLISRSCRPAPLHRLLGPGLHGAQLREVVGAHGRGPRPWWRPPSNAAPELGVARRAAGLDESLELPGPGPAVPVGRVRLERADERSVATLGPQVDVDPDGSTGDLEHRRAVASAA